MSEIRIGNKKIGGKNPCFVIAEIGSNFRVSDNPKKNFQQALKLIGLAAKAKADAVKFQLFKAKKIYVEEAGEAEYLNQKKSINKIIEEAELPTEWLPKLKKECEEKGLVFLCSPFDEESADSLEKLGAEAYKIASYAISHIPLIRHIAKKGKPMLLSIGASNQKDIETAIKAIRKEGNSQIALLQCTAKYPAPLSTINLRAIPELKKKYNVVVGLSDHSRNPMVAPLGAVTLGASIVEKHFTESNSLPGPDHRFAVLPDELAEMVSSIRKLEQAMGSKEKKVLQEEKELFGFCRRSIYATKKIAKGQAFSKENIAVLRPGKKKRGIEPKHFEEMLGKKAKREIEKNEPIKKTDF